MSRTDLVMLEDDQPRLEAILHALRADANAEVVLLLDKNGQQMASSGDLDGIDTTSLASLAAGNVAATEGLARLIGESDFSALYHEGNVRSLHLSVVAQKAILLVVFDEHSSLGLVRLRVQQRATDLQAVVADVMSHGSGRAGPGANGPVVVGEISDEDIEALFA